MVHCKENDSDHIRNPTCEITNLHSKYPSQYEHIFNLHDLFMEFFLPELIWVGDAAHLTLNNNKSIN